MCKFFSSYFIYNVKFSFITCLKLISIMNEIVDDSISLEQQYCAQNYAPLPVVLSRGKGVYLYDTEGKKYYDFLSAYSAVNQGHGHPEIIKALVSQIETLALTSRAFHHDQLGHYAAYITSYFGYDKVLPANTGVEAVEAAIKIARKWGYEKKGVPENKAQIIVCKNNFHGRTLGVISFSSDELARENFGPFLPGFTEIPFNDIDALQKALDQNSNIVAFLVEPIQGEAGVYVPSASFLKEAEALCQAHNVLLIADEIQTGLGRTGSLLALCGNCNCEGNCEKQPETYVQADMLLLGKALSGGVYPVSAVLAKSEVMDVMKPGVHGSTYGGNPVACKVAQSALEIIRRDKLAQRARTLGKYFRERMHTLIGDYLVEIRGRGLLNALEVNRALPKDTAWHFCLALKERGLLAKPTHGHIIRLAPPLIISKDELSTCCDIIEKTLKEFEQNM